MIVMAEALCIIGANDFQDKLIKKAHDMGYATHVFAWEQGAVGKKSADKFYPISIVEKEKILDICREIKPVGVISIASDLAVVTVNYITNALGLVGNSLESTEVSTNKYKMRKRLKEKGVPTPGFTIVSSEEDCEKVNLEYPLFVKPTDRSGSRGVTKVYNIEEMKKAAGVCISESFEKRAIVEEVIDGEEFSTEFINYNGKHRLLAVTKKFTTGAPHYIETGHMEPASLSNTMKDRIETEVGKALDALGINNSAAHPEIRISKDGEINIIEIGGRMGGDCIGSDLVMLSTGYDFLKMTIDVACGKAPDMTRCCEPKAAFVRFIFGQEDLDLLNRIKVSNPETIYRISDIEPLGTHAVVDSSTRYGYFILRCDSAEQGYKLLDINESGSRNGI